MIPFLLTAPYCNALLPGNNKQCFLDIPPDPSYNMRMVEDKALIDLENPKSIVEFLQAPTLKVAQFLTGLLSSAPTKWIKSAGHLVQGWIACNFFEQFGRELKDYVEKGKVKENFFSTGAQQASLRELLKFIDDGADEDRFKAMKSIFFAGISKDATEADEILAYELMQIGKKLSSNDIILLRAAYDIANGGSVNLQGANKQTTATDEWLRIVAHKIGHKLTHLVELSEQHLIDLKIITKRTHPDGSGVECRGTFRLTPLGMKLCEFITAYK